MVSVLHSLARVSKASVARMQLPEVALSPTLVEALVFGRNILPGLLHIRSLHVVEALFVHVVRHHFLAFLVQVNDVGRTSIFCLSVGFFTSI
jgi:hypothetical protein